VSPTGGWTAYYKLMERGSVRTEVCCQIYGVHEGAVPPASQGICCTDLFTAVIAEIASIILRKDKVEA